MRVDWIEQIHTTELGERRIKRNLGLDTDDVIAWCKRAILAADRNSIIRKGKNWYVYGEWFVLAVNASSYTVITARKMKELPSASARAGYDGKVFVPKSNSANGEVSGQTVFSYHQSGDVLWADLGHGSKHDRNFAAS